MTEGGRTIKTVWKYLPLLAGLVCLLLFEPRAVKNGITKGTSDITFSPNATCKRYQMVVFLKKFNDQYHIK